MASTLDWNDLKYFLAVARSGGLTPAAASMGSSASTVSRHIDAMEANLGTRLFLRQQRGYLLTDQGSALFNHVAEVERAMLSVERNGGVLQGGGEVSGLIKLATAETLACYLIAPHLAEFTRRHPLVEVELVVGRRLADLNRREADLALRLVNPQEQQHSQDFISHYVGKFPFGLYCSPMALDQGAQWQELNFISWDEAPSQSPMTRWLAELFPDKSPVLRTNSIQAQYMAARSGLGAAMLPRFVGDADESLRRLCTANLTTERELWLVYHRDLKASQRILAMRDFVMDLARRVLNTTDT